MNQDESTWEYIPGIMQLIEEGVEPDDLGDREFAAPGASRGGLRKLERLWLWLRDFQKEELLCERLPIWVPIAQLWPVPRGKLKFSYETVVEAEASAEITLCSVVGFGGASRLKLTSSVTLETPQDKGLAYLTRAYLTITRYRHWNSGEEIDLVDVNCTRDHAEFDHQELDREAHPFAFLSATLNDIKERGYTVSRIERCSNSNAETVIKLGQERLRSWKFKLSLDLPLLKLPISLTASCKRSNLFSTEFALPMGWDYAFCVPMDMGDQPLVPVCVVLK